MNIFDKALESIAPVTSLKRAYARKQLKVINGTGSGYGMHGANGSKKQLKKWFYHSKSAKYDIDLNTQELREKTRDLFYSDAIANGALKTIRTNVIGTGLKCMPAIDAEYLGLTDEQAAEWERKTLREFNLWAESIECDIERMNNFYEIQQLAFISWLMNGDVFSLLPYVKRNNNPYGIKIQLIEADRVCNPNNNINIENIVEGIERNDKGEVVAIHICNQYPHLEYTRKTKKWNRVETFGKNSGRRFVLHCMANERIGQSRGVPILAPVIEELKQLSRYTEAEIAAAVVNSMFTGFIYKDNPSDGRPFGEEDDDYEDNDLQNEIALGNGNFVELNPGEKIEFANPNRPNNGLEGFINAICRQIGASLEIPVELLLKQFTSSYSASRGALLEAWKTFKMYRSWMTTDFCQPIYEEWLTEAVSSGRITAPGFNVNPMIKKAYCKCRWNGPAQGTLDPTKEVQAAQMRVENGFTTRQQETIELGGGDYFDNNRQRIREEKERSKIKGKEVSK